MTVLQDDIDAAAMADFKNDLEGMTVEQMKRELEEVSERIDNDTAWQEALCASIRAAEKP
ncbi:hypothetical protein EVC24_160 [Rhizobium phage RHph_I4]|nr:hypothetical protein EVC24_160 [Rhizobium phage RHph_I4]